MKKTLLTLLSSFSLYGVINAQVSDYSFITTSGTYTEITGGTVLGDTTNDDERFVDPSDPGGSISTLTGVGFPIGFSFTFNGQVFDRFAVSTNGWISLGKSSLTPAVNITTSSSFLTLSSTTTITPASLRNRIAGFNDDMEGQAGSELRIETIGSAPNRICVVQWKNYRKFYSIGDNFNFQIRMKETSNLVEFVYGSFTNNGTLSEAQVGLGGDTAADFNARVTSINWASTTASNTNSDGCYITSTIKPSSGLTYIWAPEGSPPNVGVDEIPVLNTISIYPNPSKGIFNVLANNPKLETVAVQVFDIQGKVIYSASDKAIALNYNKSINLNGIAKGLYYVKLISESASEIQKIIVQ